MSSKVIETILVAHAMCSCDCPDVERMSFCSPTASQEGIHCRCGSFSFPYSWVLRASTSVHSLRGFWIEPFFVKQPFLHLKLLLFQKQIKSEDDQALAGVLLSLSGGVFRSNLLTQDNGMLTFSNLVSWNSFFWMWLHVRCCVTLPSQIGMLLALISGRGMYGLLWNHNPQWKMCVPQSGQHLQS